MGLSAWGNPAQKVRTHSTTWDYGDLTATNFLDRFPAGRVLEEVAIVVVTPFNAGVTATVGFPGDTSGVMGSTHIDLQTEGVYKAEPYRTFTTQQTLNLYITGSPTVGQLITHVTSS